MPLPKKAPGEKKDDFIQRCMDDETMKREFPDEGQRYAVCFARAEKEPTEEKSKNKKD
jgi:hypothetical protein